MIKLKELIDGPWRQHTVGSKGLVTESEPRNRVGAIEHLKNAISMVIHFPSCGMSDTPEQDRKEQEQTLRAIGKRIQEAIKILESQTESLHEGVSIGDYVFIPRARKYRNVQFRVILVKKNEVYVVSQKPEKLSGKSPQGWVPLDSVKRAPPVDKDLTDRNTFT